ncbi:MAG: MFS transporter, partial [Candidatus Limnocylindrales bacterium]
AAGLLTTIPVLCMGLFAPFGPRLAARFGPRTSMAAFLSLISAAGILRALAPDVGLLLLATLVIGIGIGLSGAIPAIVVAMRVPHAAMHATSAYAAGIVAGSTVATAVAVPLAINGDWRMSLMLISAAAFIPILIWLALVRPDSNARPLEARAPRLPWRSGTGWLLVVLFGLQSVMFYGLVSWLPNVFVERGWSAASAGSLVAVFNGVGLLTTLGFPFAAGRLGSRRAQMMIVMGVATGAVLGIVLVPDLAFAWAALAGLGLGGVFPLLLTLPVDVADDPSQAGSVAALMMLGGYIIAAAGPLALGLARDATGNFGASMWLLVLVGVIVTMLSMLLSPARLHRGVRRPVLA